MRVPNCFTPSPMSRVTCVLDGLRALSAPSACTACPTVQMLPCRVRQPQPHRTGTLTHLLTCLHHTSFLRGIELCLQNILQKTLTLRFLFPRNSPLHSFFIERQRHFPFPQSHLPRCVVHTLHQSLCTSRGSRTLHRPHIRQSNHKSCTEHKHCC